MQPGHTETAGRQPHGVAGSATQHLQIFRGHDLPKLGELLFRSVTTKQRQMLVLASLCRRHGCHQTGVASEIFKRNHLVIGTTAKVFRKAVEIRLLLA